METGCGTHNNQPSKTYVPDPSFIHNLNNQLTEALVLGTFSPPAAARIYAYANIAAYEAAIANSDSFVSFSGQLKAMPTMPKVVPGKHYIPEAAAAVAFCRVGNNVVWNGYILDSARVQFVNSLKDQCNADDVAYSASFGDSIATAVIKWMNTDGYAETRKMPYYVPLNKEWSWEPTPPKYAEALEPWWQTIRPLILDTCAQFGPPPPPPFSKEKGSEFYNMVMVVYNTTGKIMMDDTAVANFWDCNPYVTKHEGHVTYSVRQISPGGHWIGIAQIASKNEHLDLQHCCEIYSLTAVALSDAFISCWETKYRYNLIRPHTYINRYIDHDWNPILETPPFPEYTSGHSVISSAAATVLENYFGAPYHYIDSVEHPFGKQPRTFDSFRQAANEAAISRLYGGIHYRQSIENGKTQGKNVGEWLLSHVQTRKTPKQAPLTLK